MTSMPIEVATAPCSWGVDFADHPANPPWAQVLDEAQEAGFAAIDLGPLGFLPTDPARLSDELARRGLRLSAGGLFDPLADPAAFEAVLGKTRATCALLAALDAPRLVVIDRVDAPRTATAGRPEAAPRLGPDEWRSTMGRIAEIARVAGGDYGVQATLHAHAGCWIEFEDEIDRAMEDLPDDLVGLCVDTGHAAYAGIDPAALIGRHGARLRHLHLKDVGPSVLARARAEPLDFFAAVGAGVFATLGQGSVDFGAVRAALEGAGYRGLAVVEQDVDPSGASDPVSNGRANLAFLREAGVARQREAVS